MKNLYFLIIILISFYSCTKDCCYDGELINSDDALDVAATNELNDNVFTASFSGSLSTSNGKPLANLKLIFTDSLGREFHVVTDNGGHFNRKALFAGHFQLRFESPKPFVYSTDEFENIIDEMTLIINNQRLPTFEERIAYHVINFNDGITSLDRFYFEKFKSGDYELTDYQPWRYIKKSDFDAGVPDFADTFDIYLGKSEDLKVDILVFFIGDPYGSKF